MYHHGTKAKSQKTSLILTYCLKYSSLLMQLYLCTTGGTKKKILNDLMCARVGKRWEEEGPR